MATTKEPEEGTTGYSFEEPTNTVQTFNLNTMAEITDNTVPKTSWGDWHASFAKASTDGTMPTTMDDMGSIDDGGITIATTEGTKYELKDINGKILDVLKQEPSLTVTVTLVKATMLTRSKFWEMVEEGTGETKKTWVKSMVNMGDYAFTLSNPKAKGSETFEAPMCKISMIPNATPEKGYTFTCTFEILNTGAKGWFAFGTVPTA